MGTGASTPSLFEQVLTSETIERLARLPTAGHPVLSVYLDLDPTRFATPDRREIELRALLGGAQGAGADQDAKRIRRWLLSDKDAWRVGRGLAIFSCVAAGVFAAVRLSEPVEPLAVVDVVPWLEPLAAQISPGEWAVAVVSRRGARLLRGDRSRLTEFAVVDDELHRRHSQGGWSQARFQRGIEEQVALHVRAVTDRLLRAHRRRAFQHLVVICSSELRPVVERSMHAELTAVLEATVDADLEHAPLREILATVAPVMERVELDQERELISALEQQLGTGGAAAAGLDAVLAALLQQRVRTLLVPERSDLRAGWCPTCGRLSTDGERRCAVDGHALVEVDAVEHLVEEAAGHSTAVVVAHHDAGWLRQHGDVAAILRW